MHVGFAGLGKMGAVMAPRLLDAGHELTVWNRSAAKAAPLAARGATVATDPAALAAADAIVSMLGDDGAVGAFYDRLLTAPVDGKLLIDMSTIRPETVQRIAAAARARGAGFVDAPVSGTVAPARDGKLLILAGGSEADLARAKPVLGVLGRRTIHAGPVGSGAALKLVVNLPLAVYWAALAEALAMGRERGLSPGLMLDAIKDSSAALAVLGLKLPAILGEPGAVAFDVASMQKDVLAMIETGARRGVPMPTATAALSTYAAAAAGGLAAEDAVAVVRFLADRMTRRSPP
jgi:3-hydroxyisobutyrate dehydrogenase-like beta-hydroxyacid dehydrogenase